MSIVHCKKEPYDVYIGRGRDPRSGEPGRWGNPFRIGRDGSRAEVIARYAGWLRDEIDARADHARGSGRARGEGARLLVRPAALPRRRPGARLGLGDEDALGPGQHLLGAPALKARRSLRAAHTLSGSRATRPGPSVEAKTGCGCGGARPAHRESIRTLRLYIGGARPAERVISRRWQHSSSMSFSSRRTAGSTASPFPRYLAARARARRESRRSPRSARRSSSISNRSSHAGTPFPDLAPPGFGWRSSASPSRRDSWTPSVPPRKAAREPDRAAGSSTGPRAVAKSSPSHRPVACRR